MQIQLLLQHRLSSNPQLSALVSKLTHKTQQCLSQAQNQPQARGCRRDLQHYENYLKLYTEQFVEKGERLCRGEMQSAAPEMQAAVPEMQSTRRKCVKFYMKGSEVFLQNVRGKLRSLVYKLDYMQL